MISIPKASESAPLRDDNKTNDHQVPVNQNVAMSSVACIKSIVERLLTDSHDAPIKYGFNSLQELQNFTVNALGPEATTMITEGKSWQEISSHLTEKISQVLHAILTRINAIHIGVSLRLGNNVIHEFNPESGTINGITKMDSRVIKVVFALRKKYIGGLVADGRGHFTAAELDRDVAEAMRKLGFTTKGQRRARS